MRKKNLQFRYPKKQSIRFNLHKLISSQKKSATHHASIKNKFIVAFVSFALIPFMLICIIYTMISKSALRTTSSSLNLEIVRQVTNHLNATLDTVEETIVDLGANTILSSGHLVKATSSDKKARTGAILSINQLISDSKVSQNLITDTCVILPEQNQVIGSITNLTSDDLLTYIQENTSSDFQWVIPDKFKNGSVLVYKKFNDLSRGINYFVASKFVPTSLTNYIASVTLLKDSTIYLVDHNHSLLYATNDTTTQLPSFMTNELLANEELTSFNTDEHLIAYDMLSNGWKLIVETPSSSLTERLDQALPLIGLLLLAIVVLAIILGYFYANAFSKPIIHLMNLMGQAEKGDLTVKASATGSGEIAALCNSFNHMVDNIRTLITQTQEVIGHTLLSSETLNQSATYSTSNIEELATAVSEIAQGTTTQALDAQKSTQDMQGLAQQMDTVSEKAIALLANTEGAKSMIEGATSIMQSLTNTMNSSLHMTNDICDSITELNTLTQNIEEIMKLVDSISGQTNLLALNASIEAARVGEAGKGFSVVANEVRNLADQSKASTADVRATLNSIEAKMKATVSLAENSKNIISEQEYVVKETHSLFHQVIETLTAMLNELQDINSSVNGMRELKEIMLNQIDSIASVTQEAAASTEEVSSLATEQQNIMSQFSHLSSELSTNMEQLNETIGTFKVTQ